MKTAKEFFERLKTDEAFAKEFMERIKEKREAGVKNYYDAIIPAAEKYGYSVSREEIDEAAQSNENELSEEDLGKVAGGTACFTWLALVMGGSAVASVFSAKEIFD